MVWVRLPNTRRRELLEWFESSGHYMGMRYLAGAIADTDNFEVSRPTLGDAINGIVHQGARQAVHRRLRIVLADRDQVAVVLLHLDAGW